MKLLAPSSHHTRGAALSITHLQIAAISVAVACFLHFSADDFTTGYMQSKAMVTANGTVFWPPPAKLRSTCKIDITYFPFDDQRCTMKFGSWTYDGFQVNLTKK